MITDLWIENFKGIGKRQHIPIRPVTLLFGANSAGKSTVLHAMLYLRELLCRKNVDARESLAGADTINLGGFDALLHDGTDCISLGCGFSVAEERLDELLPSANSNFLQRVIRPDIYKRIESLREDVGNRHHHVTVNLCVNRCGQGRPTVSRVEVNVDQERLALFDMNDDQSPNVLRQTIWPDFDTDLYPTDLLLWAGQLSALSNESVRCESPFTGTQTVHFDFVVPNMRSGSGDDSASRTTDDISGDHCGNKTADDFSTFLDRINEAYQARGMGRVYLVPTKLVTVALEARDPFSSLGAISLAKLDLELGIDPPANDAVVIWEIPADTKDEGRALCVTIGFAATDFENLRRAKNEFYAAGEALRGIGKGRLEFNHYDPQKTDAIPDLWKPLRFDEFIEATAGDESRQDTLALGLNAADRIVRGSLLFLTQTLQDQFLYVGPKRSSVPRYLSSFVQEPKEEWGNGLGAWHWLLEASIAEFDLVSEWLNSKEYLDTGYRLERDDRIEISIHDLDDITTENTVSSFLEALHKVGRPKRYIEFSTKHTEGLQPQDLGEGITQVVPVLAALARFLSPTLQGESGIVAFEQPELHLHPSLAARLSDVFLCSCISGATILAETHSEHIILRLLRRIRQTTNGELPGHIPPVKADDVCVLYVDNMGDGTTINRLKIDEYGEFIDRWPHGFFREREEDLFGCFTNTHLNRL